MAVEDTDTSAEVTNSETSLENDDSTWDGGDPVDGDSEVTRQDEPEDEEDTDEEAPSKPVEPEEKPEPEDQAEEKPADEPSDEDRKARNREMAQKRIEEKREREKATKDFQQQFVAEADKESPTDNDAIRQLQVDAYNNKIEFNDSKLVTDYERALKDFDILRDSSPDIQAEVTAALDGFNEAFVSKDKFGNPHEVRGSLYQYLQAKADSITRLTGLGATRQTDNKAKEKSKASLVPSRTPKQPKADPDLEAFDEEANRW